MVTDETPLDRKTGTKSRHHQRVRLAKGKHVNRRGFTTNAAENFFGVFKRRLKAHIAVSEQHLARYVAESVFRYSNRKIDDFTRAMEPLKGIEGKRLTYRRID